MLANFNNTSFYKKSTKKKLGEKKKAAKLKCIK